MRWCCHIILAGFLCWLAPADVGAQQTDLPSLRAVGKGHQAGVGSGVFTPDGKTYLSAGGKEIHAWDVASGEELYVLTGHPTTIHVLALVNERTLVSGSNDGRLFIWDLLQKKKTAELPKSQYPIHALAVAPRSQILAVGTGIWNKLVPGELRLWDMAQCRELALLQGHRHQIQGLAFSPAEKQLAAVDRAGDLKIWDLASKKATTLHSDRIAWSVRFSPDGKLLLLGDMWGRIRLHDAATLADEALVQAHKGTVFGLTFHPSGRILASAGYDGNIRLWNPHRLEEQPPLPLGSHQGKVWTVAFSPDGQTLASAGDDRLVKFWSIPPAVLQSFPLPTRPAAAQQVALRTGTVKVALVPTSAVEAARSLQELTLARLSDIPELELLQRERIERLLQEQKLSLSGAVDAGTAVQAGKILAVDVLAVLHHSETLKQNSTLVIFDSASGVKLVDQSFSSPSLEVQVLEAAAAVRTAVERWRAGLKNLKTVCFLPVRNADLPRGMDHFCTALAAGLERDLLQAGNTAVLERQRLDLVNREKTLAADASTRELLASVVTIELEISRRPEGGLRALAVVRDNAGKELHRLRQETADANGAGLLAPLAQQLQEALKTTSPNATANRNRESRRFQREAQLLWKHKHYLQGLQGAEAAFALKGSQEARDLLSEYLLCHATELMHPGGMRTMTWGNLKGLPVTPEKLRDALIMGRRGLDLIDTSPSAVVSRGSEPFAVRDAQRFFFNKLPLLKITPASTEAESELLEFRRFCLQRLIRQCEQVVQPGTADPQTLSRFLGAVQGAAENITFIAPSNLDRTRTFHELGMKWLDLADRWPVKKLPLATANQFGQSLARIYQGYLYPTPIKDPIPLEILTRTCKHPHPLIRLRAQHLELRLLVIRNQLAREDAIARHRQLLAEGESLIDRPTFEPPDPFRIAMYELLGNNIGSLYLHKLGLAVLEEYFQLCDFMLDRRDVMEEVIRAAVGYGSPHRSANVKALQILDRAVQLTAAKEYRNFGGFPDRFQFHMKEARRKLLTTMPDLLKVQPPWESVQPLVQAVDLNATLLLPGVRIHEGQIYFFAGGGDNKSNHRQLQFVRLPVPGGSPQVLGKTLVSVNDPPDWSRSYSFWINPNYFVTATALANGKLYAATTTEGILVFPLAGGDPQRIGEKEGLPTRHVHKLAIVGQTLLATLEGGYIVAYDLASGRCTTVASSRRSEVQSPFDNTTPFRVTELVADPSRQRFLFTVQIVNDRDPRAGLWEYSLPTARFRKLQPQFWSEWSPVTNDRIYLLQGDGALLAYDLREDRLQLLQGKAPTWADNLQPSGLPEKFTMVFARKLFYHGWMWTAYPFGRTSLDRRKEEYYPSLRDSTWTYGFSAHVSLQPLAQNELLIGDAAALYRVRLKKQN